MAYRKKGRGRVYRADVDWRPEIKEAVLAGMVSSWTGSGKVDIQSTLSRLTGQTEVRAANYAGSRYHELGRELGALMRTLANHGGYLPSTPDALGALIFGSDTTPGVLDVIENSADTGIDFLTDLFS